MATNSSSIDKKILKFYEFVNLQRQDAITITVRGSTTQMSIIKGRRIYFYDGSHYSVFYMPFWSTYGQILYVEIDSSASVTISKARTDMTNDLIEVWNSLFISMNDLAEWNFIGSINKTYLLKQFN